MSYGSTILNQLQHLLPLSEFQSFVGQHEADKWTKHFTTKDQLTSLLYSQARGKTSLRDIETGLRVQDNSWYHLGLSGISKSTLSRAMRNRPYEIFESLFYELLKKCQGLSFGTASPFTFKNNLYALDSTVIDLCLNLFPWAHFRKEKGALKLHTLFNIRSQIPELIIESDGKTHDIEAARLIDWDEYAKGSIFVADRAYIDYNWLYDIHSHEHIFVTRMKCNAQFVPTEDFPVTEPGVIRDQRIEFVLEKAEESYPESLRLIEYYDKENDKIYRFLTNDFDFSAKNNRRYLQGSLADRDLLQVDQTTPEDQNFSRHHKECRDDTGMGRDDLLSSSGLDQASDTIQRIDARPHPYSRRNIIAKHSADRLDTT
jgi:hypothetical protein